MKQTGKAEAYFPDVNQATKLYAPSGSTWVKDEFYSNIGVLKDNSPINVIHPGTVKSYSASGGRSSEKKNAPFLIYIKNGKGYIAAIGWSGQWNCEIERTNDGVTFKSKLKILTFV